MSTCDCVKRMNEKLKPYNAEIGTAFMFFEGMTQMRSVVLVAVNKTGRGSKKPPSVPVNFCPFCGVKIEESKS